MIAGITLSRTQYEKLLKDTTVGRAKLFFSDVFSVMYSKNVGKFLASFINACTLHSDEVTKLPKATTEEKLGFTGTEEGMACHAVCLLEE